MPLSNPLKRINGEKTTILLFLDLFDSDFHFLHARYEFNDSNVHEVSIDTITKAFGDSNSSIFSTTFGCSAYMLLYRYFLCCLKTSLLSCTFSSTFVFRKVDPARNKAMVSEEEVPEELRDIAEDHTSGYSSSTTKEKQKANTNLMDSDYEVAEDDDHGNTSDEMDVDENSGLRYRYRSYNYDDDYYSSFGYADDEDDDQDSWNELSQIRSYTLPETEKQDDDSSTELDLEIVFYYRRDGLLERKVLFVNGDMQLSKLMDKVATEFDLSKPSDQLDLFDYQSCNGNIGASYGMWRGHGLKYYHWDNGDEFLLQVTLSAHTTHYIFYPHTPTYTHTHYTYSTHTHYTYTHVRPIYTPHLHIYTPTSPYYTLLHTHTLGHCLTHQQQEKGNKSLDLDFTCERPTLVLRAAMWTPGNVVGHIT